MNPQTSPQPSGRTAEEGDDFGEMRRAFIVHTPREMEALRRALDGNDISLVEARAHSLKIAATRIGADMMKDEAFRLELAARNGDMVRVKALVEKLEKKLEEAHAELTMRLTDEKKTVYLREDRA